MLNLNMIKLGDFSANKSFSESSNKSSISYKSALTQDTVSFGHHRNYSRHVIEERFRRQKRAKNEQRQDMIRQYPHIAPGGELRMARLEAKLLGLREPQKATPTTVLAWKREEIKAVIKNELGIGLNGKPINIKGLEYDHNTERSREIDFSQNPEKLLDLDHMRVLVLLSVVAKSTKKDVSEITLKDVHDYEGAVYGKGDCEYERHEAKVNRIADRIIRKLVSRKLGDNTARLEAEYKKAFSPS